MEKTMKIQDELILLCALDLKNEVYFKTVSNLCYISVLNIEAKIVLMVFKPQILID